MNAHRNLFSAAVLVAAIALPAAAANGGLAAKPAPTPAAKPAPAPPERHPKIHEALVAPRASREGLEHAAHDFGGHRVEAMPAIDEAIKQLEIFLKYDKDQLFGRSQSGVPRSDSRGTPLFVLCAIGRV